MTPDDALNKQLELYRGMTGEQRLKIALDLHTLTCNLSRAGIRQRYLKRAIRLGVSAELDDLIAGRLCPKSP